MEFGICLQSIVPVRLEPSHRSELVTQLLFGELVKVLSKEDGWVEVEMSFDEYHGWVVSSQLDLLTEEEFLRLFNSEHAITTELIQLIFNQTKQSVYPLVAGSTLPGYQNGEFSILGDHFVFEGEVKETSSFELVASPNDRLKAKQAILSDAMFYLHAPYLWGGRTPFGIDCSGLTQMVYKKNKIRLPRDSSQQALLGEPLGFLSEVEPGDLAFFDNEEGKITHVGILMDQNHIIHASGKVRVDLIDHQGIYNEAQKRYTHNLRVLKRMV